MSRSSLKTKPTNKPAVPQAKPAAGSAWWKYALGALVALIVVFEVYGPALNGPFVLDDRYLPFASGAGSTTPFMGWVGNLRPVLMFSFWLNYQAGGAEPYGYHVGNVVLHFFNAVLVWLIVRKLLDGTGARMRWICSLFAAALFLLHPVQTESVAYVASRSETLSVFFAYAAIAVFFYRRHVEATFVDAIAILLLFGAAVLSKQHTAVLPAVFLLADYFFNPRPGSFTFEGIRRNWRLYVPIGIGAIGGLAFVARDVIRADTAGFGMKDLTWSDYLLTQGRVIWVYLRLFLFPVGLNADYDFPISHSPFDRGAIFGLAAFAALLVAAWIFRRRYPLAAFGLLVFAVLLAPTSSVVPIRDPIAERRMYLPFLGLLLVLTEFLRRVKIATVPLTAALTVVLGLCAIGTYQRSEQWGSSIALWSDTAEKSPNKPRPHFQLAYARYEANHCDLASSEYERTSKLQPISYELALDWALALECANRPTDALAKLEQAARLEKSAHPLALIGMIYAKQNRREEALAALAKAEATDPNFEYTYVYRGGVYEVAGDLAAAAAQFRRALALNPANTIARDGLARVSAGAGAQAR